MPSHADCPHCATRTDFAPAAPGAPVDCPACDWSFVLLSADAQPPLPADGPGRLRGEGPRRLPETLGGEMAHTRDIRLTATGLLAAALTVGFYLGIVGPLGDTYFAQLFGPGDGSPTRSAS